MNTEHCICDVEQLIAGLEERLAENMRSVADMGRELTPVEEARFKVGLGMTRDFVRDLRTMAREWREGRPAYRVTEGRMAEEASGFARGVMVSWEYLVVTIASWNTAETSFAALGRDGWELVALIETPSWRAVFKRAKAIC